MKQARASPCLALVRALAFPLVAETEVLAHLQVDGDKIFRLISGVFCAIAKSVTADVVQFASLEAHRLNASPRQ